ncbi:MAG: very short patch repair endonuclease [Verrucomicrobia bacterium]|nr:very short patch repair endonuclease [Verrucomicrobiota bacterium]
MARRTDTVSVAERSRIMSAVRSGGNKATEMVLVKLLRKHGITGWRRRVRLSGKPDFVFAAQKVAIFVDGCFWHGCPKHCRMPKGNKDYWRPRIAGNRARDALVSRRLRRAGWRVFRVWEHELARRNEARLPGRLRRALA